MQIPPRRAEVRALADQIYDPFQSTPISLEPDAAALLAQLAPPHPHAASTVCAALGWSPQKLYDQLHTLTGFALLEGARADRLRAAQQPPDTPQKPTSSLPLRFEAGLKHTCQGCGGCCTASDIGPVMPNTVQRILKEDWSDALPVTTPTEAFQPITFGRQTVYVMNRHQDTCVFLDEQVRCRIHARMGGDAKPLPCRQFPWRFVRVGDHIDVSLYTECRSWWAATRDQSPPDEAALRALIAAQVLPSVPPTVTLAPGILTPRSAYLEAEAAMISAIRRTTPADGLWAPLVALNQEAHRQMHRLTADIREDEVWLEFSSWQRAYPALEVPSPTASRDDVLRTVREVAGRLAGVARERELPWLGLRLDVLHRAVQASRFIDPLALRLPAPEVIHGILCDLLVGPLFSKAVVLSGLAAGLAQLNLHAWLTVHAAAARSREACRVQLLGQDLNDSMVTISKIFREQALQALFREIQPTLLGGFAPEAALSWLPTSR